MEVHDSHVEDIGGTWGEDIISPYGGYNWVTWGEDFGSRYGGYNIGPWGEYIDSPCGGHINDAPIGIDIDSI